MTPSQPDADPDAPTRREQIRRAARTAIDEQGSQALSGPIAQQDPK